MSQQVTYGRTCSLLVLTAVLNDTCLLLLWDYDKTWSISLSVLWDWDSDLRRLCSRCLLVDQGPGLWPLSSGLHIPADTHTKQKEVCLKNITLIVLIQEDTKLCRSQDLKVCFHCVFISTPFKTLQQCWSDWHSMTVGKKKVFDPLSIRCIRASIRHGEFLCFRGTLWDPPYFLISFLFSTL